MKKLILVLIFCFIATAVSALDYSAWSNGDLFGPGDKVLLCREFRAGFLIGQECAKSKIFYSDNNIIGKELAAYKMAVMIGEVYEEPKYQSLDINTILMAIMISSDREELFARLDLAIK